MRKIIIFIIFIVSIFIVNLVFYFISDDYKFFLKKIKDPEQIIYIEKKEYNDDNNNEVKKEDINKQILESTNIVENTEIISTNKENKKIFKLKDDTGKVVLKDEIILGKNYRYILDLFSIYNLKKLEINLNLFDITDEYPDNYFEYYSKDLTLYLFPTKQYSEIYDIFEVISKEAPFTINEVNNFGDNSFYINLNDNIKDKFVRVVISYNAIVFGLKIKKTEYSLIKEKLKALK